MAASRILRLGLLSTSQAEIDTRITDLGNNVSEVDTGVTGNSRAYSIDRVKRECEPEVVAMVMSGEMSPNAALIRC
jgi:hypothetical protein